MRIAKLLVMLTVLASSLTRVQAAENETALDAKSDQLCQRIERCAWQHLDADNLPVQSQQELRQSLSGVCQSIKGDLPPVREMHIEVRAEACIDSMLSQSCEQLVIGAPPTRACQQLAEELAKR
ncbi:hypothetical protein ABMA58_04630 [Oceanospirillum sp. HFRX-1_2]